MEDEKFQRLKAFTLIELVVVTIISGILISIVYFSFFIISQRFTHFSTSASSLLEIATLNNLLTQDFNTAQVVEAVGDDISVTKDSVTVLYLFRKDFILRRQGGVEDTFDLSIDQKKCYINNEEFHLYSGKIDELVFESEYNDEKFYFHYSKTYASDKLIHLNKN